MQLGMIGLGRMGSNMVRRLMRGGHSCVVHDTSPAAVQALAGEGAAGATTLNDFVAQLGTPRTVWLMVPAAVVGNSCKDSLGSSRGGTPAAVQTLLTSSLSKPLQAESASVLHYRRSSGNRRNANHTGLSMTPKSIVTVLLAFAGIPLVAAGQLVLSASPVLAQLPASTRRPPFTIVVDSLVPHALAEFLVPGTAVALIHGGTVVWMRGYGFADRASGRHVTPQTAFNIGSMSKSVTSWGALHLVDEGRLMALTPPA